jgi:hypothetical protein
VQVGRSRIHSEFHPQGPVCGQFLEQLLLADQLRSPLFNLFDDGLRVHGLQLAVGGLQFTIASLLLVFSRCIRLSFANKPESGGAKPETLPGQRTTANRKLPTGNRKRQTANPLLTSGRL